VIRLEHAVGDFAIEDLPLASVYAEQVSPEVADQVRDAFSLGRYRTVAGDPLQGIRQIVDIALKALSPGVNDTTTAVNCVDHLAAILVRATKHRIYTPDEEDEGAVRVYMRGPDFSAFLVAAVAPIRQSLGGNAEVATHLLGMLARVAPRVHDSGAKATLLEQADRIVIDTHKSVAPAHDRATIEAARHRIGDVMGYQLE
jgi:uncharacterized membrane protein